MDFKEKCYKLVKKIPKGKITTYKEIAEALGTKGYRAVGNALHNNPNLVVIPCHRVVKSNGEVGGYVEGIERKIELLKKEGIPIKNNRIINFEKYFFRLNKKFK
ncbi:MGMT family protein [Methanothermococcus okinawensis]|uniref:methylated-DNA--[protein]-cysteine S-methyltransferase n=1 Tax=Methanothermococcus okinawensis (strain DSM 14208 / JCM 11175 / IH1) TaxID=647113 RepID=F8AMV2_METOI|nr:MGMT family protein [Methanothermococcus okinawensis]AEH06075.1 methylated-DNA/protein-cysteine methyltransferase [Methanothermococcus okinawensis IH1]